MFGVIGLPMVAVLLALGLRVAMELSAPSGPVSVGTTAAQKATAARTVTATASFQTIRPNRSTVSHLLPAATTVRSSATAGPVKQLETLSPTVTEAPSVAAPELALSPTPNPWIRNGDFDLGLDGWFSAHLGTSTHATVVNRGADRELLVAVTATKGSVAQDVAVDVRAGGRYSAAIRASSSTGSPVLIELAVHAMTADGTVGETNSRFVIVEGDEVPITAVLEPTADHSGLRFEVYVHTVGHAVEFDDASLLVDDMHAGPSFYGYQQPRVRFLDGVDPRELEPRSRYRVEISVDTTTDQIWQCCAVGSVRLGTENDDVVDGSGRNSGLFTPAEQDGSQWLNPRRISLDQTATTTGGSFTTWITTPSTVGSFVDRFRVVAEGVTWMPGPVVVVSGSVVEASSIAPPIVEGTVSPTACESLSTVDGTLPPRCMPPPGEPPLTERPVVNPVPVPTAPVCEAIELNFADDTLMRYEGSDATSITPLELDCSRYLIELWSRDDHHKAGYQTHQTDERWYLVGLDGSGAVVYTSPTAADLPSDQTEAMLVVPSALLDNVVGFQGRHGGGGTSANSITVAAVLRPLD